MWGIIAILVVALVAIAAFAVITLYRLRALQAKILIANMNPWDFNDNIVLVARSAVDVLSAASGAIQRRAAMTSDREMVILAGAVENEAERARKRISKLASLVD